MSNIFHVGPRIARLVPQRLREARDAKEMTMEELGAAVGVTRQAISFYEAGDREAKRLRRSVVSHRPGVKVQRRLTLVGIFWRRPAGAGNTARLPRLNADIGEGRGRTRLSCHCRRAVNKGKAASSRKRPHRKEQGASYYGKRRVPRRTCPGKLRCSPL
jgi:transcriptional regulator with XRE-family HTH domain